VTFDFVLLALLGYDDYGDGNKGTSKMLLTVSSFGEGLRRVLSPGGGMSLK